MTFVCEDYPTRMIGPPLSRIFSSLSFTELASAALVCKEWKRAASSTNLWEALDLSGRQDAGQQLYTALKSPLFRSHLQHINLEFAAGIEDGHMHALSNFNLRSLNLNSCQNLSEMAIIQLICNMSSLVALELYWLLSITDETLMTISAFTLSLEKLSLSGCKNITDQGLRLLAGTCQKLTHLNLTRCAQLTSKGLLCLDKFSKLQELHLYACSQVTDSCLEGFGRLSQLKLISLCGAVLLTDKGVDSLAACSQLESADLSWCTAITDTGVRKLASSCSHLKLLSLHGIRGITDASIDALAVNCSGFLQTLDVNGCVAIEGSSQQQLVSKLPNLIHFLVHT